MTPGVLSDLCAEIRQYPTMNADAIEVLDTLLRTLSNADSEACSHSIEEIERGDCRDSILLAGEAVAALHRLAGA